METARTLLGKIVADVVQNAEKECMQMALVGEKLQFVVRKSGLRYNSRMCPTMCPYSPTKGIPKSISIFMYY